MLDFVLDAISDHPATYLVLIGIVFIDDFVPLAPGDTAMITAGIAAANGGLNLALVIAAGAGGGIAGDNVFYLLGRRFGPRLAGRLLRGERARELYAWVRGQIHTRPATIIIVTRFIPGGRSVSMFACGVVALSYRRFLPAEVVAAVSWATYAALLGFAGGSVFREDLLLPLAIGFVVALALGLVVELVTVRRRP